VSNPDPAPHAVPGPGPQPPTSQPPTSPRSPLGGTRGALTRYRVMAMVVGTGLAIVCFIGIPLQVVGDNKWPWTAVVEIVGTAHGIFYIVYLLTCLDLASRARFRASQLLGMVCSGFLPLLAFYMERRVTKRVLGLLALGPGAPPAPATLLMTAMARRRSSQSAAERGPRQG
jgi:integral membrane protein